MLKLFETIKGYDYSSRQEFEKHKTYMESKGYKVLDTIKELNVYYFNNGYMRVYYIKTRQKGFKADTKQQIENDYILK